MKEESKIKKQGRDLESNRNSKDIKVIYIKDSMDESNRLDTIEESY